MKRILSWQLYSNRERNSVINLIKQAIDDNDGCILNFNMFSDLAMTLSVEISEHMIQSLYTSLSQVANIAPIEGQDLDLSSKKECTIFMNISFGSGKGSLKQDIPEVDG